jgi:hypothetical protein
MGDGVVEGEIRVKIFGGKSRRVFRKIRLKGSSEYKYVGKASGL